MTEESFIAWLLSQKGQAVLGGALGGVVRTLTLREKLWPDGLINIAVGGICSLYLTPLVEPILQPVLGQIQVDPGGVAGFSGFVIGLGGVSVSGFVLDVWNKRRADLQKDENNVV